MRDYDPQVGRYVESDPTGVSGGASTYAYAGDDPLAYIDSIGLQRFNPGPPPPDPAPQGRDPRTPWLPPNLAVQALCEPYTRINAEINGMTIDGLIPLVGEEVLSDNGCSETVLCTYRGQLASRINFGTKTVTVTTFESTSIKTVKK